MESSELVTGLIAVGAVFAAGIGLLAWSIMAGKRKRRRMEEDRKRFAQVYGFTERSKGGLQGVIGGSQLQLFLAKLPIPACDPLHPSRRNVGRPGHMSGIHWKDALQVVATGPADQRWFLCENRTQYRYGEDKVTDHWWHDYFRMKFEIPDDWIEVPTGDEGIDRGFKVFSAGGVRPAILDQPAIREALRHWVGEERELKILFVTARDGKVTIRALRKAFEKDGLGLFEDLDRTVRLSVALVDPDQADDQLGGLFG